MEYEEEYTSEDCVLDILERQRGWHADCYMRVQDRAGIKFSAIPITDYPKQWLSVSL